MINPRYTHAGIRFGSEAYPKYLYHLTTASAYQNILETGGLKAGTENSTGLTGVWTVERENFKTAWSQEPQVNGQVTGIQHLLKIALGTFQSGFRGRLNRLFRRKQQDLVLLKVRVDPSRDRLLVRDVQALLNKGLAASQATLQSFQAYQAGPDKKQSRAVEFILQGKDKAPADYRISVDRIEKVARIPSVWVPSHAQLGRDIYDSGAIFEQLFERPEEKLKIPYLRPAFRPQPGL